MRVTIENIEITISDLGSISIDFSEGITCYNRTTDPKWIAFCKKHHLNYIKDAYSKFYDMYLSYCIEGLI